MDIDKLDVLIRLLDGADFGDADDAADELFDWACDEFLLRTGDLHLMDPGDEAEVTIFVNAGGVAKVGA